MNLMLGFLTKWGKHYYKFGEAVTYYKIGQIAYNV